MPSCCIFDIDKTIADNSHREHWVSNPIPKFRKWTEFFNEMDKDIPIRNTVDLLKRHRKMGMQIILVTGRPDTHREMTIEWLANNKIPYTKLIMKGKGEYRLAGALWKAKIIGQLLDEGYSIKTVVDDEKPVHEMCALMGVKSSYPSYD